MASALVKRGVSIALSAVFVSSALAEEAKILFIGNSFTLGSPGGTTVPAIFERMAIAGTGQNPMVVNAAVGGTDFEWHALSSITPSVIASQPWTYVVLQNYSTEPTHLLDAKHSLQDHFTYGSGLYEMVMANDASSRVVLFETWSRAAVHPLITGVSTGNSFESTGQFQSELRENYRALADALNFNHPGNPAVIVAPAGDAWEASGGLLPASDPHFVDLFDVDNYHGNDNGYYLTAAVIYASVYGRSPESLFSHPAVASLGLNLTVSSDFLEQIAWLTVLSAADTTGPVARSATSDGETVTVKFDEILNPLSATFAPNYKINGVEVTTAALSPDGRTVTLSLGEAIAGRFSVSISYVTDLLGNTVAPGTTVIGQVPSMILLIDFGGSGTTSHAAAPDDPVNYWNNLTASIGTDSSGQLSDLVTTGNAATAVDLVMLSRFSGANENGTRDSNLFAIDATRDYLYGHTEFYDGLSGVFPSFKFTGLDPKWSYSFTFFGSRLGATDNRETGYTVTGSNAGFAALNAANNVANMETVSAIQPTAGGEVTIRIAPTLKNNNMYHFTYLNVLRVEGGPAETDIEPLSFIQEPTGQTVREGGTATFNVSVQGGAPYSIQWWADGDPIEGATELSLVIPAVLAGLDGTVVSVTVTNEVSSITSQPAILTVLPAGDTTPPVPLYASSDGWTVTLVFNEELDPYSAMLAPNYRISEVDVAEITLSPEGHTVTLTLEELITETFTVNIGNVTDLAGNPVAAGTTVVVQVTQLADVGLTHEAEPTEVFLGQTQQIRLRVTNGGPSAADCVLLDGQLGAGMELVNVVSAEGMWSFSERLVRIDLGPLEMDETAEVELVARAVMEGSWTNRFEGRTLAADRKPENNGIEWVTVVRRQANLVVGMSSTAVEALRGREVEYTIAVTNLGPQEAEMVEVDARWFGQVELVSVEPTQGEWTQTGRHLIWTLGTLPVMVVARARVVVVPFEAGEVLCEALGRSATFDRAPEDNQGSASVTIRAPADLLMEQSINRAFATVGQGLTYTISVSNRSDYPVLDVRLLDELPAGVELVSTTLSQGIVSQTPGGMEWTLGSLNPEMAASILVTVVPRQAGPLTNQVSLISAYVDSKDPQLHSELVMEAITAPSLTIRTDGTQVVLEWPAIAEEFHLEVSDGLSSPMIWVSDGNPQELAGDRITITVAVPNAPRFYRLVSP